MDHSLGHSRNGDFPALPTATTTLSLKGSVFFLRERRGNPTHHLSIKHEGGIFQLCHFAADQPQAKQHTDSQGQQETKTEELRA